MILTTTIKIKITKQNIEYYSNFYTNLNIKDILNIKPIELPKGSHKILKVKCDKCGNEKEMMYKTYITNTKLDNIYYCRKCNSIRKKRTFLKKYGVDHPMKNDKIMNKTYETNLKKYGVKMPSMLKENELKKQETNLKKYGVRHIQQNDKVFEKSRISMNKKYNVDYPIQNTKIKEKIKNTMYEKYGVFYGINLNKYDYSDIEKNKKIIEKTNKTKFERLKKNYKNINFISYDNDDFYIKCNVCKKEFKINKKLFSNRLKINTILCTNCFPQNSNSQSGKELQLLEFIKDNYNGEIQENKRNIIPPYELDIYLHKLKLAFEFNGLYWHNELNKSNNYHLNKTDLCKKQGIQLIHIWEDDWNFKEDIVKSIIINKLKLNSNEIYARKTKVMEINDNKIIRKFLDNNHIQGFVGSSVELGLFFENELVSLMTFGKKRSIQNSKSKEGEYELLRFCNKKYISVIGGSSRLFKYFKLNYNPKEIITYVDRSYSNGNLYKELGMSFVSITQPNYHYIIDGIRKYRFGFRKDILVKKGYDKTKSEHEIMIERKIYRIYNSGNLKYNYSK